MKNLKICSCCLHVVDIGCFTLNKRDVIIESLNTLSLLHTGELAASTLNVCVAKIKFLTSGEPLSFVTDKPNNKHV